MSFNFRDRIRRIRGIENGGIEPVAITNGVQFPFIPGPEEGAETIEEIREPFLRTEPVGGFLGPVGLDDIKRIEGVNGGINGNGAPIDDPSGLLGLLLAAALFAFGR